MMGIEQPTMDRVDDDSSSIQGSQPGLSRDPLIGILTKKLVDSLKAVKLDSSLRREDEKQSWQQSRQPFAICLGDGESGSIGAIGDR